MDSEKSIEDQFSKLHPCLPVNTRIGIVGGGPSGLSAAYALVKLGYTNVTILESCHTVGGMCASADIEGRIYDLGGQVLAASSAPMMCYLANEIGCELEEMDSHKVALIDSSTGEYKDMKVVDDYLSIINLTLKLQDEAKKDQDRIGVHAVSDLASDLAPDFLEAHGFKRVPKSVAYGYTASGYGFVDDMPYAYLHEFTRTSTAGKIRRFKGGYMSVWQKISERLPLEIRCKTEVVHISRNSTGVDVDVIIDDREIQHLEFDKIILSGSFPFRSAKIYQSPSAAFPEAGSELMDTSDLEKDLFSKVKTIDYYTTVLKIKGLEHLPMGFYYFGEFMENPASIGHPVAMQRFYADTDIFLFWSYGNAVDVRGPKVTQLAVDAVQRMGGEVEKVVLQRQFKYFPHVSSQDMKDGFYDELEYDLQGQLNTYYVGGLMAFELTERNASYAMARICKHFATHSSIPKVPYVKRLFPLQPNKSASNPNLLDELSGLNFPNLSTLDEYLRHWGTHELAQNKTLYTWVNDKGEEVDHRTYKQLHENASHTAHKLLTSQKPVIKPGDRVLLVYIPGLDFVDAFFGCLRAKVIAVPVIPPDPSQRGGQALLHIQNIAKSCNAVAVLSTFNYHTSVRATYLKDKILLRGKNGENLPHWPDLPWLYTESRIKSSKSNIIPFSEDSSENLKVVPDDLSFLQFTSGSTGDAKGVMITHRGLIHNVKLMKRRYKSTSKTVLISWLPQYHDMGLIGGLFTCLISGGSAILYSPTTFIKNPLLWLKTMSKYRATHSAGPNFAFELIVRRLETAKRDEMQNLNLSSMVFLMVAAEPVRAKTLKRFIELTRSFGLSQEILAPGYGLAENCVFVSCAFGEGRPVLIDWQGRVCCGYVDLNDNNNVMDVDIRIVHPESGKEHEESENEGEIWISSPSAGTGYWGKEELTQKIFKNELENHPGRTYTRTGDLGRIIEGNLFVTGRIKDLIIVAGRNIYSSDVEKTVESSSEVLRPGCCAVIGVSREILLEKGISESANFDDVGIVVIAETREGKSVTKEDIGQIQTRVAEEHGIDIAHIAFIKPRTICKTSSGKIRRFECLKQFIEGTLNLNEGPVLLSRRDSEGNGLQFDRNSRKGKKEIVEFLKKLLSDQTGISVHNISLTESLMSYGVDSIGVVRSAQKLSEYLGVPVGAIDIFTATCIDDLANFAENLMIKSQPRDFSTFSSYINESTATNISTEATPAQKLGVYFLQFLALLYVLIILLIPPYFSVSVFASLTSSVKVPYLDFLISLALAPLSWFLCIFSTSISIAFLGNSFLQPNYAMTPEISIWSMDFVKWWALYKAQEASSKILAFHLRGTVFLNYWFELLGAKIGSSVLLDTVDITDPSLVSIGDGAVIAEGALIQSHEVKNGILSFLPVRIGRNSFVGPYAVVQKGSVLGEGDAVPALQKSEGGKQVFQTGKNYKLPEGEKLLGTTKKDPNKHEAIYHLMGIYLVDLLSTISAAIVYFIYLYLSHKVPSIQQFSFICICGAFHWLPFTVIAYTNMFLTSPSNLISFAFSTAFFYMAHGLILSFLTSSSIRFLRKKTAANETHLNTWLRNRIIASCDHKFARLLSGTEAFCMYLRLMGAKIGHHCSIRAINSVSNPELMLIGDGVHLGDFSRIITGFHSTNGFMFGTVEVQDNSVVGSQSVLLPNSVIQSDVILGAISISPMNSVLQKGGIFVGSENPIMVKNSIHSLDDRIEEMDIKYKKLLGNLASSFAASTLKVKSRYFHRIGAAGKGILKFYDDIPLLPDHKIFSPGKTYPVIIRHSNCLSADDDARIDPRGAALRILSNESGCDSTLLDITLKTGNAFHARTISDFATWLVCGVAAREEHVKRAPHIREAMWTSLRRADSYTELHYYSNICRLFRFKDGQEMYVKFKLRPSDENIGEDSGRVEPMGILPPETGAIPRDEKDTRPFLFLDEDFQQRVDSFGGVHYVLQIQIRSVPPDAEAREAALDCTKPWDQFEFPYIDVGEITIDQTITKRESEVLEFNPYLRCSEVDVIRASSFNQSASLDHGRSVIYDICQHLRNRKPLPVSWRIFVEQSDIKVDLSGCPMAGTFGNKDKEKVVTLARRWYQTLWALFVQPLLQTFLPYFIMGLVIFAPLNWVFYMKSREVLPLTWLLLMFWVSSGILAALACVLAKWALVGKKKEFEVMLIWSRGAFMDTIWQAVRTVVGECFMEITSGSVLFGLWMKLMGSKIGLGQGVYVDSMGAMLNPEMVEIERGGSVGRDALLFGHIYDGDSGKVKYGKIRIGDSGFIGSRAVAMPGVRVESGGNLSPLTLAMKEELIRSK